MFLQNDIDSLIIYLFIYLFIFWNRIAKDWVISSEGLGH